MKILFISQGLPFPVYQDGLTVRVYHLLKEMSKFAKVHLVAFGNKPLTGEEELELSSLASYSILDYQVLGGVKASLRKLFSYRRFYDIRFHKSVIENAQSFKPDVIFCEQTFMAQYVIGLNAPVKVMSAVDAISLAALRQANISSAIAHHLAWRYVAYQRRTFERKYYRMFDIVTAVGREDAKFLSNITKKNVLVIPNGVDTEYFLGDASHGVRDTILFTGNLSAPMNEEACIYLMREVFPEIHNRYPHIKLEIAGRAPTTRVIEMKPHYVCLNPDVPDLREIYQRAICCVSPIIYGTGIKNNVLQAMSMGVPVIVTPLIAEPIGILHGTNGLVAERGGSFVLAIESLLSGQHCVHSIGQSARNHVEQSFSWTKVGVAYIELFSRALSNSKAKA